MNQADPCCATTREAGPVPGADLRETTPLDPSLELRKMAYRHSKVAFSSIQSVSISRSISLPCREGFGTKHVGSPPMIHTHMLPCAGAGVPRSRLDGGADSGDGAAAQRVVTLPFPGTAQRRPRLPRRLHRHVLPLAPSHHVCNIAPLPPPATYVNLMHHNI